MRIRSRPLDDPVVLGLIERVQQEYVVRYGGPDATPLAPSEFAPPHGVFLVAYDDDGALQGCGGWRAHREGVAEVKRMYVVPEARGRGVARAVLAELERTATAAGRPQLELFTGTAQPEAMALYVSAGYRPVPGFGPYMHEPEARYFGKHLQPGKVT